ncbi:hypothetical protein OS187_05365 [Xanthomonadaceae bacterium JHOS43]|nr:hypothetical protein [Xanthomonadaceae bacterium JHOS43]
MSIRTLSFTALALSTALLGTSVLAGNPGKDTSRRGERGPQPVVLAEANERILAHATALDANGDGVIDAGEFAAMREKHRGERMHKRGGSHRSGAEVAIPVEEFVAKRQERLAARDLDGDGTVSTEEFRQTGAKRHPRGPRPERGEKPATR